MLLQTSALATACVTAAAIALYASEGCISMLLCSCYLCRHGSHTVRQSSRCALWWRRCRRPGTKCAVRRGGETLRRSSSYHEPVSSRRKGVSVLRCGSFLTRSPLAAQLGGGSSTRVCEHTSAPPGSPATRHPHRCRWPLPAATMPPAACAALSL